MKVLVGRFSSESNEHSRSLMSLDKFILKYGEDCIDSMYCRDIFEKNGIELIPSIGAIGHPHGPVTLQAYEFIVDKFKQSVKEHLHEIDGIFLFLHGASKVIGLQGGSAELDGHRQILPRADRQDAVLPELRQRGRQPAVHLDDEPRVRQEGQMDAVRPAGRLAAERLDGPGIHHAQEHRRDDRHAHRGSPGHVARHGRHASGRHPQRRGRVRETPVPHALAHQVREQGAPERQGLHALMRPEITGPPTAGTLAGKAAFGPQFRP